MSAMAVVRFQLELPWNPQISVQFSKPRAGEPLKLSVQLTFDDVNDPVEVLTRVR